jgi:hypothetical protein
MARPHVFLVEDYDLSWAYANILLFDAIKMKHHPMAALQPFVLQI